MRRERSQFPFLFCSFSYGFFAQFTEFIDKPDTRLYTVCDVPGYPQCHSYGSCSELTWPTRYGTVYIVHAEHALSLAVLYSLRGPQSDPLVRVAELYTVGRHADLDDDRRAHRHGAEQLVKGDAVPQRARPPARPERDQALAHSEAATSLGL